MGQNDPLKGQFSEFFYDIMAIGTSGKRAHNFSSGLIPRYNMTAERESCLKDNLY